MTIISSIRSYLAGYSGLKTGAPLWVNYLSTVPAQYAIVPLGGQRRVETYIDASNHYLAEYPFAFQSMESTADQLERLENIGFYEAFAEWLDTQTEAGSLPTMDAKKTAESIEATGWGFLYEQGQSSTGVYQIQCKLVYEQK